MNNRLVRLVFPDSDSFLSPSFYEEKYPLRDLPAGAMVTRFAPSPTGSMHIGGIYASLINKKLAEQSGGVFFLRIEDTDTKRYQEGTIRTIIDGLHRFGLPPDEGVIGLENGTVVERGDYGPYIQSNRVKIYHTFTAHLMRLGHAYPCFCTEEDLENQRIIQREQKVTRFGYYGKWAKCRQLSFDEAAERLRRGFPFVIRLRAVGDYEKRIVWEDYIKGSISMPEYDHDIVLLKRDGIPTYHLAHVVDDHFMRTTHVIRADEWVSSVPLHLQLFRLFSWAPPAFGHFAPIEKIETVQEIDAEGREVTRESRRKLSKRKDAEANIDFYAEMGFPEEATIEYLANLFDSSFEPWRDKNPEAPLESFRFTPGSLAAHGALSDVVKIASISKDIIARMDSETVYQKALNWAREFDPELAGLMAKYPDYTRRALDIERTGEGAGKRIRTWKDLRPQLAYMFDELFAHQNHFEFPENMTPEEIKTVLRRFLELYDEKDEAWFERVKEITREIGFAESMGAFKKAKGALRGHVGDVAMVLRVALCGSRQSPDLRSVMLVMGRERVTRRLSHDFTKEKNTSR
ncbi:MAG: glutamate--tRNA ligase [Blastocatellia bacterium]|nr:glutamate--tRNA ligase [Blastocatellia bacterium]